MSMMVSFVLSFFPRDVLDEILNLIESVSEDFPSYSVKTFVSKMLQNQERSQQDLLGRAFDEVFPHGIPELDSPV